MAPQRLEKTPNVFIVISHFELGHQHTTLLIRRPKRRVRIKWRSTEVNIGLYDPYSESNRCFVVRYENGLKVIEKTSAVVGRKISIL